jgi:hypothetical protein
MRRNYINMNRKLVSIILTALLLAPLALLHKAAAADIPDSIPLAGQWRFLRDDKDVGMEQKWFSGPLAGTALITLPGTTDEGKLGDPQTGGGSRWKHQHNGQLERSNIYIGPAWYQSEITIPEGWKGKRVELFLERALWQTDAWLDGRPLGMRDSLCVPHRYDLGMDIKPGPHRLTIRVDNRMKYDLGQWAHSITETTQTKWNGLIGRLELRATPPVWLEDVQVYPDIERKQARVVVRIGNGTGRKGSGKLEVGSVATTVAWDEKGGSAEILLPLEEAKVWDEFSPSLTELKLKLGGHERTVRFGLRKFEGRSNGQFALNGRPTFLRGTLDCCIFPLTGYPSMDVEAWAEIFRIAKEYGLNHIRFHSWCPPEAAFVAADEAGMLLQPELPWWVHDVGSNQTRDEFVRQEMLRILETYGNHPSFVMFSMGNELAAKKRGDFSVLNEMVMLGKRTDPRHLYCTTSNPGANNEWLPQPTDDFLNAHAYRGHGNQSLGRRGHQRFEKEQPQTSADYSPSLEGFRLPVVSHEVGQWSSYPDFEQISKYTGVLRPTALINTRDALDRRGWLYLAPAWARASGLFALELYREEIERSLRTPNYGGFQLLDMRDFPGQGTALVGILDAFWDSKGLILPAQWRRFCAPTVTLARMDRRVWTCNENFTASAELAHYGAADLAAVAGQWSLRTDAGAVVAKGEWPVRPVPTGGITSLGQLSVPLGAVDAPARLNLTVSVPGTEWTNEWAVWVYPTQVDTAMPSGLLVSKLWDGQTRAALEQGRTVLLLAGEDALNQSGNGQFTSAFWGSGAHGILCDPAHPALAQFPTEFHTNWQWWELLTRSRRMRISELPASFRPVVEVMSDIHKRDRWANVMEARVGNGRLMVCSIDLETDLVNRPVARQLLKSLCNYIDSDRFQPAVSLSVDQLETVLLRPGTVSTTGYEGKESATRMMARGDGWQLDKAKISDPLLPRVLLIGDALMGSYLPHVIEALEGKAHVDAWIHPYNQATPRLSEMLAEITDSGAYSVIHFNMGLNGWKKDAIPAEQFETLTKMFVSTMHFRSPQSALIWANTTPVFIPERWNNPARLDPNINPMILQLNSRAARVMQELNVPINDLYSLLVNKLDQSGNDPFTWKEPAQKILAEAVADSILQALPSKKQR